jgi:hypothetical protein
LNYSLTTECSDIVGIIKGKSSYGFNIENILWKCFYNKLQPDTIKLLCEAVQNQLNSLQ